MGQKLRHGSCVVANPARVQTSTLKPNRPCLRAANWRSSGRPAKFSRVIPGRWGRRRQPLFSPLSSHIERCTIELRSTNGVGHPHQGVTLTPSNVSKYLTSVDTHRHPFGPKLRDKMGQSGQSDFELVEALTHRHRVQAELRSSPEVATYPGSTTPRQPVALSWTASAALSTQRPSTARDAQ
jgi:hypothetical protein